VLEDFTFETFSKRIGDRFRIVARDSDPLAAELIDATAGEGVPGSRAGGPFSLVFRGPLEPVLPQRIYRLENESLGAFELFIVPIGPDDAGMQYEAVFA
jgi:hypothetical protein